MSHLAFIIYSASLRIKAVSLKLASSFKLVQLLTEPYFNLQQLTRECNSRWFLNIPHLVPQLCLRCLRLFSTLNPPHHQIINNFLHSIIIIIIFLMINLIIIIIIIVTIIINI